MVTINIHNIKSIEIKPIDISPEGYSWRTIKFIDENDNEHTITAFPINNDKSCLNIEVPFPVKYAV